MTFLFYLERFEKEKTFPYLPLSESIDGTKIVFKVIDYKGRICMSNKRDN